MNKKPGITVVRPSTSLRLRTLGLASTQQPSSPFHRSEVEESAPMVVDISILDLTNVLSGFIIGYRIIYRGAAFMLQLANAVVNLNYLRSVRSGYLSDCPIYGVTPAAATSIIRRVITWSHHRAPVFFLYLTGAETGGSPMAGWQRRSGMLRIPR